MKNPESGIIDSYPSGITGCDWCEEIIIIIIIPIVSSYKHLVWLTEVRITEGVSVRIRTFCYGQFGTQKFYHKYKLDICCKIQFNLVFLRRNGEYICQMYYSLVGEKKEHYST